MDDMNASIAGDQPTCRICRSEATIEEPLFHPCRCSGSIRNVHQDCLVEWLSHSQKKHCELCKTPYRFTKLYDARMPSKLPWRIFIQQAILQIFRASLRTLRVVLVSAIWLVVLPWVVRWSWRWLFWFADAGWARDVYLRRLYNTNPAMFLNKTLSGPVSNSSSWINRMFGDNSEVMSNNGNWSTHHDTIGMKMLSIGVEVLLSNDTTSEPRLPWEHGDASIFSSVSYISALTPYPSVNRIIVDIFEGQLITCTVILAFILIFLIREWVVQQQPIVNLDQLNVQREQEEQARRERQRAEAEAWNRLAELELAAVARSQSQAEQTEQPASTEEATTSDNRRPKMPDRHSSSRATHIQRMLSDTDGTTPDNISNTQAPIDPITTTDPKNPRMKQRKRPSRVINDLPIANAGPDSKLNIKIATTHPLRFPQLEQSRLLLSMTELRQRLNEAEEQLDDLSQEVATHDSTTQATLTESPEVIEPASVEIDETRHASEGQPTRDDVPQTTSLSDSHSPGFSESTRNDFEQQSLTINQHAQNGNINHSASASALMPNVTNQADDHSIESTAVMVNAQDMTDVQNMANVQDNADAQSDSDWEDEIDFQNEINAQNMVDETAIQEQAAIDPQDLDLRTEEERANDAAAKLKKSTLEQWLDWFWDDIQPTEPADQVIVIDEQQLGLHIADAPQPIAPPVREPNRDIALPALQNQNADPEVVAAAQQAGLDAEAVDDAEDIEGLMELVGLRGPLAGLIQTAAFCLTMVICTVLAAVILPYFWGKLVLGFIGNPLYFVITLPLQTMSFLTDFLVDIVLFVGSAVLCGLTFWSGYLLSAAQSLSPRVGNIGVWISNISNIAMGEASASGSRLRTMLDAGQQSGSVRINSMLSASLHSHLSLKELLAEIDAVMHFFSSFLRGVVDLIINSDLQKLSDSFSQCLSVLQAWTILTTNFILKSFHGLSGAVSTLRTGNLTLPSAPVTSQIDPALVYWSSTDRSLAVCAGYLALAVLASIYVALDTPITRSPSGQKTEKMIRDSLRQAGGVFKVILIISIEMLVFPFYCGALLDLAFLPLFANSTFTSRIAFAFARPYIFCFVHWFVGTCYMFHFALFVGMCRKILRKGVLWFIRDPDDPTFHPVRDVLERNVTTQLRKIAFSALVYGALVILCLGGVIWTIGKVFKGIFPVHWTDTEPLIEFPVDLLLYNFLTPLAIRFMKPGDIVQSMYAWWLKRCARALRLSHFLFDDRKEDEETVSEHGDLMRVLHAASAMWTTAAAREKEELEKSAARDGKWVLTPCTDQFKVPKPNEYYLHLDNVNDMHIADKNGKRNDQFAKIYIPPRFRFRMTLFMVCLWVFSAFIGLCATLLPLIFGRSILQMAIPHVALNDIYAYTIGSALLSGLLYVVAKGQTAVSNIHTRIVSADSKILMKKISLITRMVTKSVIIYGFIAIVLPTLLAISVETYVMIPLHTYLASIAAGVPQTKSLFEFIVRVGLDSTNIASIKQAWNQADLFGSILNAPKAPVVHHVHFVEDFALGIFFLRLLARMTFSNQTSRAAEALRRATEKGLFDLDFRIVRRFLIIPSLVIAAIVLAGPPFAAWFLINIMKLTGLSINADRITEVYRYSYPLATALLCTVGLLKAVSNATARWRSRIRDEVYLVGERLHNYGETRPPAGSRSIIRRA